MCIIILLWRWGKGIKANIELGEKLQIHTGTPYILYMIFLTL